MIPAQRTDQMEREAGDAVWHAMHGSDQVYPHGIVIRRRIGAPHSTLLTLARGVASCGAGRYDLAIIVKADESNCTRHFSRIDLPESKRCIPRQWISVSINKK